MESSDYSSWRIQGNVNRFLVILLKAKLKALERRWSVLSVTYSVTSVSSQVLRTLFQSLAPNPSTTERPKRPPGKSEQNPEWPSDQRETGKRLMHCTSSPLRSRDHFVLLPQITKCNRVAKDDGTPVWQHWSVLTKLDAAPIYKIQLCAFPLFWRWTRW